MVKNEVQTIEIYKGTISKGEERLLLKEKNKQARKLIKEIEKNKKNK